MFLRALEALAVAGVPWLIALASIARLGRPGARIFGASLASVTALFFVWLALKREPHRASAPPVTGPFAAAGAGFVGSRDCKACHPGPYESWHASYHRTMTQVPTPETVAGDFDGATVAFNGATYRFERDGRDFVYVAPGEGGPRRHRIVLLTGSHHMQVAWFAVGHTRTLDQVPFVWLIEERRWVPRNAAFLRPPDVAAHPPSESGRWNHTCLRCHSVNPLPRLMGNEESDTRVAELGIACEACHGPGEAHVRANRDPLRRFELHVAGAADPTIVNPARLSPERSTEVCGQCHSVSSEKTRADWEQFIAKGFEYRPGDELARTRAIIRYTEKPADEFTATILKLDPTFMANRYWKDGMLRVTGREMSALLESPCSTRGKLSCITCHSLHGNPGDAQPLKRWADDQLRPEASDDRVCARCHEDVVRQGGAHTHHATGSSGSSCQSCHMPFTTYGLHGAIRSHRISRPSATETHDVGRPNACNLCHLDRTLAWTADRLAEWYGTPRPPLTADESAVATGHLWLLSGDAGQRAVVAWNAGRAEARATAGTAPFVPDLAQLLDDPYESVRLIAWRSLRTLPDLERVGYDFLGPREARLRARDTVLERARGTAGANPAALDRATFERLLGKRDDRPMDLSE